MMPFLHRPPRRCWPSSAAGCGWTWPARLPGLVAVASSWANEAAESRHRPMRERGSRPCRMVGDCLQHLQVGSLMARPRADSPACRSAPPCGAPPRGVEGPHRWERLGPLLCQLMRDKGLGFTQRHRMTQSTQAVRVAHAMALLVESIGNITAAFRWTTSREATRTAGLPFGHRSFAGRAAALPGPARQRRRMRQGSRRWPRPCRCRSHPHPSRGRRPRSRPR
jgi:hypothetical protein